MNIRAHWQFYKDCFPFIYSFALVCLAFVDALTGLFILFTIANGIGFLAFSSLKSQEFYFYYNLGISKLKLLLSLVIINAIVGLPFAVIFIIFKQLFFANA